MRLLSTVALAFTLSACGLDAPDDEQIDQTPDEEGELTPSDVALYGFSGWHRVASTSTSYVEIRYCKTSTRLNWEFRHNPYDYVQTGGTAMSSITSNISGVYSGSKYRSHNNSSRVFWNFAVAWPTGPLYVTGFGEYLSNIPAC